MPRKKNNITNLPAVRNPHGFGISGISEPSGFAASIPEGGSRGISYESEGPYSEILDNPTLSIAEKKRRIKALMVAAAKEERAAKRGSKKSERLREVEGLGLGPREKRTYDEKRSTSRGKGLSKRDLVRDLARAVPQTAAYYGISADGSRKESAMETRELS